MRSIDHIVMPSLKAFAAAYTLRECDPDLATTNATSSNANFRHLRSCSIKEEEDAESEQNINYILFKLWLVCEH